MSREITDINSPSRWNMRIWDVKNKEWLGQSDNDGCIFYGFDIRGGETTVFSNMNWLYNQFAHGREFIWEQSTGLKDKNGKEIYEGDIVEYDWYIMSGKPAYRVKEQVVFNDMGARVGNDRIRNCSNVEVIGNIHENPELLEGEK